MDFTDLCGQEHVKRALEVALAGSHSIRFTGSYTSQAGNFAKLARELGLTARATGPCPCGFYGHPIQQCTCSIQTMGRHQARERAKHFDIEIEVSPDDDTRILAWLQGRRGERLLGKPGGLAPIPARLTGGRGLIRLIAGEGKRQWKL